MTKNLTKVKAVIVIEPVKDRGQGFDPIKTAVDYIESRKACPRYLIEVGDYVSPLRDIYDFRMKFRIYEPSSNKEIDIILARIRKDIEFFDLVKQ